MKVHSLAATPLVELQRQVAALHLALQVLASAVVLPHRLDLVLPAHLAPLLEHLGGPLDLLPPAVPAAALYLALIMLPATAAPFLALDVQHQAPVLQLSLEILHTAALHLPLARLGGPLDLLLSVAAHPHLSLVAFLLAPAQTLALEVQFQTAAQALALEVQHPAAALHLSLEILPSAVGLPHPLELLPPTALSLPLAHLGGGTPDLPPPAATAAAAAVPLHLFLVGLPTAPAPHVTLEVQQQAAALHLALGPLPSAPLLPHFFPLAAALPLLLDSLGGPLSQLCLKLCKGRKMLCRDKHGSMPLVPQKRGDGPTISDTLLKSLLVLLLLLLAPLHLGSTPLSLPAPLPPGLAPLSLPAPLPLGPGPVSLPAPLHLGPAPLSLPAPMPLGPAPLSPLVPLHLGPAPLSPLVHLHVGPAHLSLPLVILVPAPVALLAALHLSLVPLVQLLHLQQVPVLLVPVKYPHSSLLLTPHISLLTPLQLAGVPMAPSAVPITVNPLKQSHLPTCSCRLCLMLRPACRPWQQLAHT